MEDKQIVDLYLKRDENAISETKIKYGNYCYSIAYNILFDHEDSEECVNDSYLGTWNSIPPHIPSILSTYIGKITRRISLNRWRSKTAEKRGNGEVLLSFDEIEDCIADKRFEESLTEEELTEILNDFLKGLKTGDRKVFVCRYFYFESIAEISNRFNFSISKTKMILKRTRDKLKIVLRKKGVWVQ